MALNVPLEFIGNPGRTYHVCTPASRTAVYVIVIALPRRRLTSRSTRFGSRLREGRRLHLVICYDKSISATPFTLICSCRRSPSTLTALLHATRPRSTHLHEISSPCFFPEPSIKYYQRASTLAKLLLTRKPYYIIIII